MTEASFSIEYAYRFLEDIKNKFKKFSHEEIENAITDSLSIDFAAIMKDRMVIFLLFSLYNCIRNIGVQISLIK